MDLEKINILADYLHLNIKYEDLPDDMKYMGQIFDLLISSGLISDEYCTKTIYGEYHCSIVEEISKGIDTVRNIAIDKKYFTQKDYCYIISINIIKGYHHYSLTFRTNMLSVVHIYRRNPDYYPNNVLKGQLINMLTNIKYKYQINLHSVFTDLDTLEPVFNTQDNVTLIIDLPYAINKKIIRYILAIHKKKSISKVYNFPKEQLNKMLAEYSAKGDLPSIELLNDFCSLFYKEVVAK